MFNPPHGTTGKTMKTKSRTDLYNQVYRIAMADYAKTGKMWYTGVSANNSEFANKVWAIFMRYQNNIVRALGREPAPRKFPFQNVSECALQFPASIYTKQTEA